jgi:hypothetical protein
MLSKKNETGVTRNVFGCTGAQWQLAGAVLLPRGEASGFVIAVTIAWGSMGAPLKQSACPRETLPPVQFGVFLSTTWPSRRTDPIVRGSMLTQA